MFSRDTEHLRTMRIYYEEIAPMTMEAEKSHSRPFADGGPRRAGDVVQTESETQGH